MKNMIKRIIIGIIIGLVLMACRKYLFINASAATIGGQDCDTPNIVTIGSGYNNVAVRIWTNNIFPNQSQVGYSNVVNRYVYVTACTDMPTLGYSFPSVWNSSTGSSATGVNIKFAGNLTSKTCTFSNGVKGNVAYFKFRLVNQLLNVPTGSSNLTGLYNDYMTFYIGTNRAFSFTIQSMVDTYDDFDIYADDFDTSNLERINQALYDVMVASSNSNYQALNNVNGSINNMNNNITDSSVDDPTNDINNMSNKVASNGTITQLLTLPIQLYQNILNSVNGSCNSFNLGNLLGTSLLLPCINLQQLLGTTLYGIIDILCSGLFILAFRKKMVDIFNHMTSLNDRGNELE